MLVDYHKKEDRIFSNHSELQKVKGWLLGSVSFLIGLGIVLIYSSSAIKADSFGTSLYFVEKQATWILIGIAIMFVLSFFDYRKYFHMKWLCLAVSFFALLAVKLSNMGNTVNGAQRWIKFGSFSFQPSEFIKVFMIIALAGFLAVEKEKTLGLKKFSIITSSILGVAGLVLIEPDFGTAALIATVLMAMLVVGGANLKHVFALSSLIIAFAVFYIATSSNYILQRIQAWLEGGSSGKAYHAYMSIQCMTSGGLLGKGPGAGWAKLWYLPEAHTDFIYSVAGQDMGLICCVAIIFVFALIVYSGWKILNLVEDRFAALLAFGITVMIGLQAAFNIAVVTATVPTKGISLPFISFGGSGLIASMAMIGILISIIRHSYRPYIKLVSGKAANNPWGKHLLAGMKSSEAK